MSWMKMFSPAHPGGGHRGDRSGTNPRALRPELPELDARAARTGRARSGARLRFRPSLGQRITTSSSNRRHRQALASLRPRTSRRPQRATRTRARRRRARASPATRFRARPRREALARRREPGRARVAPCRSTASSTASTRAPSASPLAARLAITATARSSSTRRAAIASVGRASARRPDPPSASRCAPTPRSRRASAQIPRDSAPSPPRAPPRSPRAIPRAQTPQPHPPTVSRLLAGGVARDPRPPRRARRRARRVVSPPRVPPRGFPPPSTTPRSPPSSSSRDPTLPRTPTSSPPRASPPSPRPSRVRTRTRMRMIRMTRTPTPTATAKTPTATISLRRARSSFAVIRVGADATETARARLRARRLAAFALTALHAVDRATSDEAFAAMTRAVLRAVDPEAWRGRRGAGRGGDARASDARGLIRSRRRVAIAPRVGETRERRRVRGEHARRSGRFSANGHSRARGDDRLVGTMCARVVATRARCERARRRSIVSAYARDASRVVDGRGGGDDVALRRRVTSRFENLECLPDREFGTARDAGWILANLAEAAPAGIANERCAKGRWRAATTFAEAAADAIAKLPADVVFGRGDGDDATSDGGILRKRRGGILGRGRDGEVRVGEATLRGRGVEIVDEGRRRGSSIGATRRSGSVESAGGRRRAGRAKRTWKGNFGRAEPRLRSVPRLRPRSVPRLRPRLRRRRRPRRRISVFARCLRSSRRCPADFEPATAATLMSRVRHAVHPPRVDGDSNASRVSPQNSLASSDTRWFETLGTFAAAYGTFLLTGDDEEFAPRADRFPRRRLPRW